MKIGILLGRGVEGVGLTKNVVEFQNLYPDVEVFATIDKLWQRMDSMKFNVNYFRGADWDEVSKPAKKFPDLMSCTDVVKRLNKLDACIVFSVPSKSHPEECGENFLKMLDEIKVRRSLGSALNSTMDSVPFTSCLMNILPSRVLIASSPNSN